MRSHFMMDCNDRRRRRGRGGEQKEERRRRRRREIIKMIHVNTSVKF